MARSAVIMTMGATGALSIAAIVLLGLGARGPSFPTWGFRGFPVLFSITFGAVGGLIAWRLPGNRIGWLFTLLGVLFGLLGLATEYVAYGALVAPGSLPMVPVGAWLLTWIWIPPAALATTFLPLYFPDGRFLSARWRPVAWLALAAIAILSLTSAVAPGPVQNAPFVDNPLGWPALDPEGTRRPWPILVGFGTLAIAIILSVACLGLRLRRSQGIERQQLKWFTSATVAAGLVLAGPGTLFNAIATGSPGLSASKASEVITIFAILAIPIAAGIAILRYHLFDIDVIIRRGVIYGALSLLLAGVYAVTVVLLQAGLSRFTSSDTVAVAASTLAVAALFGPVRAAVQRWVDRLFYRRRYDAGRVAESFAARLRGSVDLDQMLGEMDAALHATIQPSSTSVWLRSPAIAGLPAATAPAGPPGSSRAAASGVGP